MRPIKVAAGVVNQTPLDWDGNLKRITDLIVEAKADGVSLLCLPELCLTGYGCEDAFLAPGVTERSLALLDDIRKKTAGIVVSVGFPLRFRGAVYNVAALIVDRKIVGMVAKQALAGDGIHYEPRWFKPWPKGVVRQCRIGDQDVPLGDLLFEVGGVRIGFEICEDAWIAQRPGIELAARAADIILNPSASHFAFGKQRIRERFVLEGSRAFHSTYIYSNLLGNESGRIIYDGGAMVASAGQLVARGPRFGFERLRFIEAVADIDLTRTLRAQTASARSDLQGDDEDVVVVDYSWPTSKGKALRSAVHPGDEYSKEEEFTHALILGLFDYMVKSRSRGFVVSLSGGADSAAVATLVTIMIRRLTDQHGREAWRDFAAYLKFPKNVSRNRLVRELLLCVYQATDHSSDTTQGAATLLSEELGADFMLWNVQELVDGYRAMVEKSLGRKLTWTKDDLALQNIQARTRAPGVWMMANIRNALLLATSNRSEAAVGYATMDGDTCGGLSPISGIDKAFLRRWLRWMEKEGSSEFPPIPGLSVINAQQPTAELRPLEQAQTDEGDLMPYRLLDAIERSAIRDKRMPVDVFVEMRGRFPEYEGEQLRAWVKKFFQLWSRNQWKRERYAPSFHLDDENLDPKTWCRFPILSGGFQAELRDLDGLEL